MQQAISFFGYVSESSAEPVFWFRRVFWHLHDHFIPTPRNNYHPHLLSARSLALLSGLLVTVKIFTIAALSFGPVMPAISSAITEENIVSLTNVSRVSAGLPELKANSLLSRSAQLKAEDMLAKGYFSHNSPDGRTPWEFIESTGYGYIHAGENLAVNFTEAEEVESAWMNSPGHKANILNKAFEEIGIGIAQGAYQGKNAIFVVQMFGTQAAQKITLSEEPTKVLPVIRAQQENENFTEGVPAVPAPAPRSEVLGIAESSISAEDSKISLVVKIIGEPVKVMARFGGRGVLLSPSTDGSWKAELDFDFLVGAGVSLVLEAYDMFGNKAVAGAASFSGSTPANFSGSNNSGESKQISLFGHAFSPKIFESQFFLIVATTLLVSLVLAIAIKMHIQHVSLVANASFVVMLAVMLWRL